MANKPSKWSRHTAAEPERDGAAPSQPALCCSPGNWAFSLCPDHKGRKCSESAGSRIRERSLSMHKARCTCTALGTQTPAWLRLDPAISRSRGPFSRRLQPSACHTRDLQSAPSLLFSQAFYCPESTHLGAGGVKVQTPPRHGEHGPRARRAARSDEWHRAQRCRKLGDFWKSL